MHHDIQTINYETKISTAIKKIAEREMLKIDEIAPNRDVASPGEWDVRCTRADPTAGGHQICHQIAPFALFSEMPCLPNVSRRGAKV
jgi:hypothetical protein